MRGLYHSAGLKSKRSSNTAPHDKPNKKKDPRVLLNLSNSSKSSESDEESGGKTKLIYKNSASKTSNQTSFWKKICCCCAKKTRHKIKEGSVLEVREKEIQKLSTESASFIEYEVDFLEKKNTTSQSNESNLLLIVGHSKDFSYHSSCATYAQTIVTETKDGHDVEVLGGDNTQLPSCSY